VIGKGMGEALGWKYYTQGENNNKKLPIPLLIPMLDFLA
jgi:hypothetical protein